MRFVGPHLMRALLDVNVVRAFLHRWRWQGGVSLASRLGGLKRSLARLDAPVGHERLRS